MKLNFLHSLACQFQLSQFKYSLKFKQIQKRFSQLVDCCVFEKTIYNETFPWQARCMEELPIKYVREKLTAYPRLSLGFRYGEYKEVALHGYFAERSSFLHPFFEFWSTPNVAEPQFRQYLVEDIPLGFDSSEHRPYLKRMFKVLGL